MWVVVITYGATRKDTRSYMRLLSTHPRVHVAVSETFFHAKVSSTASIALANLSA